MVRQGDGSYYVPASKTSAPIASAALPETTDTTATVILETDVVELNRVNMLLVHKLATAQRIKVAAEGDEESPSAADLEAALLERTSDHEAMRIELDAAQRELEAARCEGKRLIIEVCIVERTQPFICGVWGLITVEQLSEINDALFNGGDEEPFLGEPESVAGVRLKVDWILEDESAGYWDFTTIARCTYFDSTGELWTPSDAARESQKVGEATK